MGKEISTTDIGKFFIGAFKETEESESLVTTTRTGGDPREYELPPLSDLIEAYEAKSRLPLHHDTVADLADDPDFIRVKKPKFPRAPIKPRKPSNPSKDDAARYEAAIKQYRKNRTAFEDERAEVWKDADVFINGVFGRQ
jgi:hypothetical protein